MLWEKEDCLTSLVSLRLSIIWTILPQASSLSGGSGILVFELISQIKSSIFFLIHLNILQP